MASADKLSAVESTFERHFSPEQLGELWGMSEDFVRRLFLSEAGVVVFYRQQPGKTGLSDASDSCLGCLRVHRRMRKI